jgi:surface carbohydrate biosynthesis protein
LISQKLKEILRNKRRTRWADQEGIRRYEICLQNPPRSNIVIFDEAQSELIANYILKGYSYFVYNMRPEKIYISPLIIYYFIKSLRRFDSNKLTISKGKLRSVLVRLRQYYRMASFFAMKPKIVISSNDNSAIFHWLSKNYKDAEFFAIQNGHRRNYEFNKAHTRMYIPHFFCYGDYDKDRYLRYGHVVENSYPVGSLMIGIYRERFQNNNKKEYDISIISEYRNHIFRDASSDHHQKRSQILTHKLLAQYVNKNQSLKVALINNKNTKEDEIDFFRNIYNDSVNYIKNDRNKYTSYNVVDKSSIVVGFQSTLTFEAFGMGRKVLVIDFTDSNDYNDYEPIILLKKPSYSELENRLNELLAEPYEDYHKRTKEYASYVMNYDPSRPPHKIIREIINQFM